MTVVDHQRGKKEEFDSLEETLAKPNEFRIVLRQYVLQGEQILPGQKSRFAEESGFIKQRIYDILKLASNLVTGIM